MMTHRGRAWRRHQRRKHGDRPSTAAPKACWQEKPWRLLYFRSAKLKRARQLGRYWPYREWEAVLSDAEPIRVLFVCSKNQWRSPTAEKVYAGHERIHARSRGTSRKARRTISSSDIRWADVIFAMEDKHRQQLQSRFRDETALTEIHVLDIPDEYQFMDPELVQCLRDAVDEFLTD